MQLEPITFDVTQSEDEFLTLQIQYSRRKRIFVYVLLVILMACLSYIGNAGWGMFFLLQAFALIGALLLFPLALKKQWKKQFASNLSLQKQMRYTFSPEGIAVSAPSGTSKYGWEEAYAAIVLPDGMLFFLSSVNAIFLPKSAIAAQWEPMLQYVELAPKRKRKLSGEWK